MKLHELKANQGARKDKHRKGRGHAAGKGKQAGLGQSGQNKRGGTRPGFEGGQNPWFRRLPKRGFNNVNHVEYQVVSLSDIDRKFNEGDTVDFKSLLEKGIITRNYLPVKVLANGEINRKLIVKVDAASAGAVEKIKKAGGSVSLNVGPSVNKEEDKIQEAVAVELNSEETAK